MKEIDTNNLPLFDVVIVGAGLAGTICAKDLQQKGYKVLILDKARGVGGRAATRRRQDICIDHGLQYLKIQVEPNSSLAELIQQLCDRQVLEAWHGNVYELNSESGLHSTPPATRYIPPAGMSAIAKFLVQDLAVWKQCLVKEIEAIDEQIWQLTYESADAKFDRLNAKAIVIAIPTPQAIPILKSSPSIPTEFISQLHSVEYSPCIAVMTGYQASHLSNLPPWQAVKITSDQNLAWIALDSNKRKIAQQPVFVLHSTAQFAREYLEEKDLQPAATRLLHSAAKLLLPWLENPEWFQVHKWRYALTTKFLSASYLSTKNPLPLVGCGDWCGGKFAESAIKSGMASAIEVDRLLRSQ